MAGRRDTASSLACRILRLSGGHVGMILFHRNETTQSQISILLLCHGYGINNAVYVCKRAFGVTMRYYVVYRLIVEFEMM